MPSLLITGASGCVGSYLVDVFAPNYELFLLVRNPSKLYFDPSKRKNITVITGDMDSIVEKEELLSQMDYCIHTATAWGGEGTERTNVQRVHQLFNGLNPDRLRRVIYFSTASILGRDNKVLSEAGQFGTDYIKTKYLCYSKLKECRIYDRIVTVFPTLIFGGDQNHPFSNLSLSLPHLRSFAWLLGRLNVDISFQYVHAQDIANMVRYFIEMPHPQNEYVLGNELVNFGDFIKQTAEFFGQRIGWQIPLSPKGIYRLALFLGAKMSAWDKFCLKYDNFSYQTVNCKNLGLPSNYTQLEAILGDWRLIR